MLLDIIKHHVAVFYASHQKVEMSIILPSKFVMFGLHESPMTHTLA